MESFWAALAGAVVGGIASTIGSLIVNRRAHARAYRATIYGELLPPLYGAATRAETEVLDAENSYLRDAIAAVQSAAHVVGGRDAAMADQIHDAHMTWRALDHKMRTTNQYGERVLDFPTLAQKEAYWGAGATLAQNVYDYRTWVRDQLNKSL